MSEDGERIDLEVLIDKQVNANSRTEISETKQGRLANEMRIELATSWQHGRAKKAKYAEFQT